MSAELSDMHSCNYYCERPECVRQQRDELRGHLFRCDQVRPVEATVGSAPKRSGLDVIEIVAEYLDREGYDGLYESCGECACKKDDLAPCGEIHGDCAAGYLQPCPPDCGEHDWHIGADKPNT